MGRRLGRGGLRSSRIAESMAAMAWSCVVSFFSMRASSSSKALGEFLVGGEQLAQLHEGAHDIDAHGDGVRGAQDVAAWIAPCSVKA